MVTRFKTKSDYVYENVKENIINGEYKPGTSLIIKNVAEEYEVSETPVREALKRLEAEGLVKLTAHSGIKVAVPSVKKLKEMMDIRINLELLAVKKFYENINNDHIDDMKAILDDMILAVEKEDIKKYSILDKEFHGYIFNNCENETLKKIIFDLWNKSEYVRSIFSYSKEFMETSVEEHIWILDLMNKKGYVKEICEIYENHKKESFKRLIDYLQGCE